MKNSLLDYNNGFEIKNSLLAGFQQSLSGNNSLLLQSGGVMNNLHTDFEKSVAMGMKSQPRKLECQFLYDARGSAIYEQICNQPEYYLTRTEASILAKYAEEIHKHTGPVTLIELGSGSSIKTNYLFNAYSKNGVSPCYVPVDISDSALRLASQEINQNHPQIQVIGINSTYESAFPLFSAASPAMIIFLGSTIGNLTGEETDQFLDWLSFNLSIGDYFLLGIDLVKSKHILEAAYNDAAGVTEQFTCNYFVRMNRELGCSIDVNSVRHVAHYNTEQCQIEIHAEFTQPQEIFLQEVKEYFTVDAGEKILIEISRKFHLNKMINYLKEFGLEPCETFTDERGWFSLLLLRKIQDHRKTS